LATGESFLTKEEELGMRFVGIPQPELGLESTDLPHIPLSPEFLGKSPVAGTL
jgi:hypothetical protein